ncbi:pyridoxamine 5'-phosphate oxidase, FMN-binding family [Streptomyces sp. MP131-18]|nr:pyridoxamine 5'-phosphate oxidase, FMN-binding family [Streptomyces sp. MP131-18]
MGQGSGHLPALPARPGGEGERAIQRRLGTERRAERFYDEQVLDHLNERMREFVARQEMFFLATSDARGECDNSFRAGPAGFLHVLDPRSLAYPEYRGNGVHASLGNITENPRAGLLLMDFDRARIGLHINGTARIVPDAELRAAHPELPSDTVPGRRAELWVRIDVVEAYIHCAKHIPQLVKASRRTAREWGTDDYKRKGGDFFGVAREAQVRRTRELNGLPAAPAAPAAPASAAPAPALPAPAPAVPPAPAPLPARALAPAPMPPAPPAPSVPPPPDVRAWQEEARRALERARSHGGGTEGGGGWFG